MSTNYGDEITEIDAPAEVSSGVPAKFRIRFSAPQSGKIFIKCFDENLFQASPLYIKIAYGEKQSLEVDVTIKFEPNPPLPCRLDFVLRHVHMPIELKVKQS